MIETRTVDGLEVFSCQATGPARSTPLLFVHGAFAGGWMWTETIMPYLAAQGYTSHALSLRGHGGSDGHDAIDWHSIANFVDDVKAVADWIGEPPVLIGHSMGGFVIQKYLEQRTTPAAVLMASTPPQGLVAAQFHLMMKNPQLFMDINRILGGNENPRELARALQDALFSQPVEDAVLFRFLSRMQRESHRAIWDMSMFSLPRLSGMHRPPMLIVGGEDDMLIPAFLVQSTAQTYGLHAHIFRGMGHALTHEKEWPLVAAYLQNWLDETLDD